jgi:hypothetical protein
MRVALCLYGLTGSVDFGYGLGKPIDPRIGHHHHKKRIIDVNENVDVFFHTWNTEFEDLLVDIYKPKGHIAEKQILFNPNSVGKNSIPSRWWSNAMVMQLKRKYEEDNGFKYDWVILYRFDHIFLVNLNLSEFDNQYIYFRHSNGLRAPASFSHGYSGREECTCYDKKGKHGVRLHDVFTFGSSDNLDKFTSVYDYHEKSGTPFLNPHDGCYAHLKNMNLENKLKFAFFGYDPHAPHNIMECEIIRALFEDPSYDETKEFDINNFNMFTDNLTSNPIVQSRFPGWAGWGGVDKAELKENAGFSPDAKI